MDMVEIGIGTATEKDPYTVELLDLWNEVGGQMKIVYHTTTITLKKETLQEMRDNGFPTNVLSCIAAGFGVNGKSREELLAFVMEAEAAGAAPSVTFEAAAGESLHIKGRKENPITDGLVQAICQYN